MSKIGIMQGRLSTPVGGRLQAFPAERWVQEFALARSVPLDYLEWIYEEQNSDLNPIATIAGVELIRISSERSGVAVRALCADYFMDRPLVRCGDHELAERQQVLAELIHRCSKLGILRVVLPFVDSSAIIDSDELLDVAKTLLALSATIENAKVELHLETSLDPTQFADLMSRIDHPMIRINYDTGNSASLGYRPADEFRTYGRWIGSVHIKDRVCGGGSVPLGSGDADFETVFGELGRFSYSGDFTLQVARGQNGEEVEGARNNLAFIRRFTAD